MKLEVSVDAWPVRRPFRIAYHTFHHRDLLRVAVTEYGHRGCGEAGGHPHLEPIDQARERLLGLRDALQEGVDRQRLLTLLPPGPARNALDCALWDLEAKRSGRRVWALAGLPAPRPIETAYTIGIGPAADMVREARERADFAVLKLKVDGDSGFELLAEVAAARPDATFIIDANEAWGIERLEAFAAAAASLRVVLIEQPLPRDADEPLANFRIPIPLAADESFHTAADIDRLRDRYQAVNIKLDKVGGLTAALEAAQAARRAGLDVMVGCNGGTSLGIAPAYCVGLLCRYVDLDSPLLLARDRDPALPYRAGRLRPPPAAVGG
ncbi:MAG: dipeptide epimerase [Pseudomonadales bacterium]